jgi:hypothetical protein
MVDTHPIRTHNWSLQDAEPAPEADDPAELSPTVDVVVNVYREKRDGYSFALRLSFRLPEKA